MIISKHIFLHTPSQYQSCLSLMAALSYRSVAQPALTQVVRGGNYSSSWAYIAYPCCIHTSKPSYINENKPSVHKKPWSYHEYMCWENESISAQLAMVSGPSVPHHLVRMTALTYFITLTLCLHTLSRPPRAHTKQYQPNS